MYELAVDEPVCVVGRNDELNGAATGDCCALVEYEDVVGLDGFISYGELRVRDVEVVPH